MQNTAPEEKEFILEIENKWTRMGKAEGQARVVTRQLLHRFGTLPGAMEDAIRHLTLDRLDDFADALLDFKSLSDAQSWLGLPS